MRKMKHELTQITRFLQNKLKTDNPIFITKMGLCILMHVQLDSILKGRYNGLTEIPKQVSRLNELVEDMTDGKWFLDVFRLEDTELYKDAATGIVYLVIEIDTMERHMRRN